MAKGASIFEAGIEAGSEPMWKLVIVLLMVGCTQVPTVPRTPHSDVSPLLDAHRYFQSDISTPLTIEPGQITALSEQAKRFLDFHIPPGANMDMKQEMLVLALGASGGLDMDYDPAANFTASQSFHLGRVNCLSYSILVSAMAEYVGLQSRFYEVDVPAVWDLDQSESLFVNFRHVNVRLGGGRVVDKVIDINLDEYRTNYPQRELHLNNVLAQFYNNMAVEYLRKEDFKASHQNFRQALILGEDLAYIWGNLGVLLWRMGFPDDAEKAFSRALTLDVTEQSTISNLVRLRYSQGEDAKAAMLERLLTKYREANPYFQYMKALDQYHQGEYADALVLLRQAMGAYPFDLRFYHLEAKLYWRLNDPKNALASLAAAIDLSESYADRERFSAKYFAIAQEKN